MSQPTLELQQAIELVKEQSRRDPSFRKLALEDPAAALRQSGYTKKETNIRFAEPNGTAPAGENVLVVELPAGISTIGELSDQELEQVAGGGDGDGVTWHP